MLSKKIEHHCAIALPTVLVRHCRRLVYVLLLGQLLVVSPASAAAFVEVALYGEGSCSLERKGAGQSSKHFVVADIQLDGKHSEQADAVPIAFWNENRVFLAHRSENAVSGNSVSLTQVAPRPARITAFRRVVTSVTSSRRLRSCSRVLLNAACVNKTASRGSSVNREAKM